MFERGRWREYQPLIDVTSHLRASPLVTRAFAATGPLSIGRRGLRRHLLT